MNKHRDRARRFNVREIFCVESLEGRTLLSAAYHLSFDDEFNTFDTTKWKTTDYWNNRTLSGNGEQEWYSDTASNGYNPFSVSADGVLTITAEPTPAGIYSNGLPYVSGEITTAQHYYQQYGYFELRAQLPAGKGLWPAFWMLPSNGSWPPEYDIFEVLGHDTDSIYQTSHWKGSAGDHRSAGANYAAQVDSATGFHTYGFEWDAKEVKWYVDGVLTQTQINRVNMPMYTLINLAVGGYWPGNPDGTTLFPAHMQLDYMRIYSADTAVAEVAPQSGYSLSPGLPIVVGAYQPPTQPVVPFPSGWTSTDIGSPAIAGSSAYFKTATWTLRGAGADINGTADQFQFAGKDFSGDGTLRAKVTGIANTNADAKAGVMFRAGTAADAPFVGVFLTAGHRVAFEYRTAAGAVATTTWTTGKEDPLWVRIVRSGDTYTGAYSGDGSTWTTVGSVTIAMGTSLKTGLAATSHDAATAGLATFSDVSIIQSIPKAPTSLIATTNTASKIVLTWQDNSNNETYFRIQRSLDGTTYTDLASTSTNVTTYTDTTVVAGTLYYYRVRSANPAGTSAFTNVVSITAPGGTTNAAPTIATPPSGSPNPVAGTTTTLTVLGADDGGEANLSYTWSYTGPAAVSFSANSTNAAKSTVATFTQAGSYAFSVLVKDTQGLSTTANVNVTVNQTTTTVAVTPASTSVNTNATKQFSAAAYDQFGAAMATPPTFTWSVISGSGSINTAGLYTATGTAGAATVQASAAGVNGTAAVTVTLAPPTAPSTLKATTATANQINLTWTDASNNESGFKVEISSDGGATFTQIGTALANATSYSAGNLIAATSYQFRIRATNNAGDSGYSNTVSAKTLSVPVVYQAESATLGGGAVISKKYGGYTGTGYVDLPKSGGSINWAVNAATAGSYTLSFRYALASTTTRTVGLKINGVSYTGGIKFTGSGGWNKWATISVTVNLLAGANSIVLTTTGQDSGNIDSMTVTSL